MIKIDTGIYILILLPIILILVRDQKNLHKKEVFWKYFMLASAILILGVLYRYYIDTENKDLVYFGSQMTIIFLILYQLVRVPYRRYYNREPEISRYPKHRIDIVPTLIVLTLTMILPYLIDFLITKIK